MTTTIHSIIREALSEAAGLADSLMADDLFDTIATECEAAIRAMLTSDAVVERACIAERPDWNGTWSDLEGTIEFEYTAEAKAGMRDAMRAALEAVLTPEAI